MNKKIVELDTQAKDYAAMELAVSGHGGIPRFNQLYRDKFAELIVRECAENFAKVWYEQGLDICGAELDKFMKRFNEHFGVEL
jgi:hypothetical protein